MLGRRWDERDGVVKHQEAEDKRKEERDIQGGGDGKDSEGLAVVSGRTLAALCVDGAGRRMEVPIMYMSIWHRKVGEFEQILGMMAAETGLGGAGPALQGAIRELRDVTGAMSRGGGPLGGSGVEVVPDDEPRAPGHLILYAIRNRFSLTRRWGHEAAAVYVAERQRWSDRGGDEHEDEERRVRTAGVEVLWMGMKGPDHRIQL